MEKTLTKKFKANETQRLLSYKPCEDEYFEQVILSSPYYQADSIDCFQNLLYGFIHSPKIKETEEAFFSFFVTHIKKDEYFQIFKSIPTFASKFMEQYKPREYSNEEFSSILKEKNYFDLFDFLQFADHKKDNDFKNFYYNTFTKDEIKKSIFNFIAFSLTNEQCIYFVRFCIDNNHIQKEDLITFALNPENPINGYKRFYILNDQTDYEFKMTNINQLVNLIKDDVDFSQNIHIEFYAEFYQHNPTLWLIYAGLKLSYAYDINFNEFIYKHNEQETLSLFKDFKNNYPNLYQSLYVQSAINLTDKVKSKSVIQKIILSLDMYENGLQNNIIKKRL